MHAPIPRPGVMTPLLQRRQRRRRRRWRLQIPRRARGVSRAGRRRWQPLGRWRLPLRRLAPVAVELIRLERHERWSRSFGGGCGLGVRRSCGWQQRRHDERRRERVRCCLRSDRPQKGTPVALSHLLLPRQQPELLDTARLNARPFRGARLGSLRVPCELVALQGRGVAHHAYERRGKGSDSSERKALKEDSLNLRGHPRVK